MMKTREAVEEVTVERRNTKELRKTAMKARSGNESRGRREKRWKKVERTVMGRGDIKMDGMDKIVLNGGIDEVGDLKEREYRR